MTATVGDAFAAADVAAAPDAAVERAGVGTRARARGYRSLPVLATVKGWVGVWWADLRSAWFAPASLPTLQRAWAERIPDRDRVPGGNPVLYGGWVGWNHAALVLVTAALVVVAALTVTVWTFRHPARALLAAAIAAPLTAYLING